jgi:hypothetical protein
MYGNDQLLDDLGVVSDGVGTRKSIDALERILKFSSTHLKIGAAQSVPPKELRKHLELWLVALVHYVPLTTTSLESSSLAPLTWLSNAVSDLNNGNCSPLLQPVTVNNRPSSPNYLVNFRARCVVAAELTFKAQIAMSPSGKTSRADAEYAVFRKVAGLPIAKRAQINRNSLKGWRRSAMQRTGRAREAYLVWRDAISDVTPDQTVEEIVDCLLSIPEPMLS